MPESGNQKALAGAPLAVTIIVVAIVVMVSGVVLVVWLTLPKPEVPPALADVVVKGAVGGLTTPVLLGLVGLILAQAYWLSSKIDGLGTKLDSRLDAAHSRIDVVTGAPTARIESAEAEAAQAVSRAKNAAAELEKLVRLAETESVAMTTAATSMTRMVERFMSMSHLRRRGR